MNIVKSTFTKLKYFNWKLFISLVVLALFPAIYQTIRTFIISSNTSTSGIDIVAQMEWYDLIDETLKGFLIVPLYSLFNKFFKKRKEEFSKITFLSFLIVFLLYMIFNIGLFFYGKYLIQFMNPNENDISSIYNYLKLETIAFIIAIIPTFINVIYVTVSKATNVYIFLIVQAIFTVIGDFVFVPKFGVNGIAYSNIMTYSFLTISSFVVLKVEGYIKLCWFKKDYLIYLKETFLTGLSSGGQLFIDNFIYAIMIVKMVNMVSNQGNYWVSNNFIWLFLLIPISALAEIIKKDCQNEYKDLIQSNYYLILIFTFIIWLILFPTWSLFFKNVEKLENYNDIFLITAKLVPFYIFYSMTIIPDSIFIGYGKTYYSLINSLIINFIYYGIWFILFKMNLINFSIDIIILMFGFSMVFHEFISIIEEKLFFRKSILKTKHQILIYKLN